MLCEQKGCCDESISVSYTHLDVYKRQLYMSSAEQGNPYASLELAKMYRDGFGTEPDLHLSLIHI